MLVYKSLYLLITILVFKSSYVNGSNQLHIGGIFPIGGKGGWQGGQGEFRHKCIACDVRDLWFSISPEKHVENIQDSEASLQSPLFICLSCALHTCTFGCRLRESSTFHPHGLCLGNVGAGNALHLWHFPVRQTRSFAIIRPPLN